MPAPFGELAYLYLGSADVPRDSAYYRDVLGADLVWSYEAFGARVAAFRVGEGPLVLLADHRPAPSAMPVYAVPNVEATARALAARGWKAIGERFEIPDGPCYRFDDPSGNPFAFHEPVRPRALEREREREGEGAQRA